MHQTADYIRSWSRRKIIFVIFGLSLGIRLIHINWGLPEQTYPWVNMLVAESASVIASFKIPLGFLNNSVLVKPVMYLYIMIPMGFVAVVRALFIGELTRQFLRRDIILNLGIYIITARVCIAVVCSLIAPTIFSVFDWTNRRFLGLFVALLSCFSWFEIVYSRIVRYDEMLVAFWAITIGIMIYLVEEFPQNTSNHHWAFLGLMIAVSMATKPTGYALLTGVVLLPFLCSWKKSLFKKLTITVGTLVTSYLFLMSLGLIQLSKMSGWLGATTKAGGPLHSERWDAVPYTPVIRLSYDFLYSLPFLMGIGVMVTGLLGLFLGIYRKETRKMTLLIGYLLCAYWLPVGIFIKRTHLRDLLPLLPVFFLLSGIFVYVLRSWLSRKWIVSVSILLLISPVWFTAQQKWILFHKPTHYEAREWIERNIPPETSIMTARGGPPLIPTSNSLRRMSKQLGSNRMKVMHKSYDSRDVFPESSPRYDIHPNFELNPAVGVTWQAFKTYLQKHRIKYFLASSATYGKHFLGPGVNYHAHRFHRVRTLHYRYLASSGTVVERWIPQLYSRPGFYLQLYKIDYPLPEKPDTNARFVPFKGMHPPDLDFGYNRKVLRPYPHP